MGDYALEGLSTRSFEHLVQALALRAIGDRVTVFGDGPDGGREATFEGSTDYGSTENRWNGYGVIQAKFRARPQGTSADGEWFLKQLKDELSRLSGRKEPRKPEYFIVATNVTLSPSAEAGAKDRVTKMLRTFALEHGVIEFDIWDYDKLRIMLDNSKEVRRRYSAFITSGDVLSELQDWLNEQRVDFHDILVNFLQKEVISDQFAKLEQAGYSADDQIPLSNVFVDLPVATEPRLEPPPDEDDVDGASGFTRLLLEAGRDRFVSHPSGSESFGVDRKIVDENSGRFVLIGGPGQGKTTVGQYLCQLHRCALLQEIPAQRTSHDVRQAIGQVVEHSHEEGLELPRVRRFPLRIVLSEFASQLASGRANSLLSFVTSLFNKRTDADLDPLQVKRFLAEFPCLIVLDGLDEVPSSSNRGQVLQAIREFWIDLPSGGVDALVVATTRPQGYNDDFSPGTYRHLYLVPLRPTQALGYGSRLTRIRFGSDPDRAEKVLERLERASKEDSTARLMRSPLQVTIMTLLVDRMGRPPQERWHLFNEYYKLIYQREIERDIPAAEVLRDHRVDIDKIHRRVALLLQSESERSGRTDARLSSAQFAFVVENRLREEGFEDEELVGAKARIIEGAATRLVFLVGVEEGTVGFEIRSLQEFMAAEGLMDGGDDIIQARLEAIAPNTNWRNVFLFAAGKCFSERQYLRGAVVSLCGGLNETSDDDLLVATLAGSQLALEILEDGSPRRQPAYMRQLARIALRILRLPPSDLHRRLAEVYHPALSMMYRDEIETALRLPHETDRLGGAACAVALAESHPDEFLPLIEEHFSTQIGEHAGAFHVAARYGLRSDRVLELLVAAFPGYPESVVSRAFPRTGRISLRRRLDQPGLPGWFTAVLQIMWRLGPVRSSNLRIALPAEGSLAPFQGMTLGVASVRGEVDSSVQQILTLPKGHPDWEGVKRLMEFVLDPRKDTLAGALRASPSPSSRFLFAVGPWPLRASIRACRTMSGEELAELAARGQLGDLDTWTEAEDRWARDGVSIDDLLAPFPYEQPSDIARIGFPVNAAGFSVGDLTLDADALGAFLDDAWPQEFKALVGRRLALDLDGHEMDDFSPQIAARFTELLAANGDWYWAFLVLPFTKLAQLPESVIQMLDDSERPFIGAASGSMDDVANIIVNTYNNHPDSPGVLGAVAQLAGTFDHFPLPLTEYSGPESSATIAAVAAIDVRVGREVDDNDLRVALREHPAAVSVLVGAVDLAPVGNQERVLLQLLRAIPRDDWLNRSWLADPLAEALARRRSPLATPGAWPSLQLTPGPFEAGLG